MNASEAAELLRPVVERGERWADLGAGRGTFTRALATLTGTAGRVHAVDRDAGAVAALRALEAGAGDGARVTVVHGDLTSALPLPPLDGALVANALHFVAAQAQARALRHLMAYVRPGGRLVVVEYDGRRPSQWVPFPVSFARLGELASQAGLAPPTRVATRPSRYGGTLYVAVIQRAGDDPSPAPNEA